MTEQTGVDCELLILKLLQLNWPGAITSSDGIVITKLLFWISEWPGKIENVTDVYF